MGGAGLVFMHLARQSGRSGHWYYQSQIAYNLANAGLKETFHQLQAQNNRARAQAQAATGPGGALTQVLDALLQGSAPPSSIRLIDSSNAGTLPPSLAMQLSNLRAFAPTIEVDLSIQAPGPLWPGPVEGIPANPRERAGRILLVARASARNEAGLRVERTVSLQKAYKVVSILPPLLGRFVLFTHAGPRSDPNFVPMTIDPGTGECSLDPGGARPLIVRAGAAVEPVRRGTNDLDRKTVLTAFPSDRFLDTQGWIHLGGDGTGPWNLRMAHGTRDAGETPLLPGYRFRTSYRTGQDQLFMQQFESAINAVGRCATRFVPPLDGLYYLHHGFATNFELVGVDPSLRGTVQSPGGGRKAPSGLEPALTSGLRLFGPAGDAVSPTLVFGAVNRVMVRRASVQTSIDPVACALPPGTVVMNLLALGDHGPSFRQVLTSAFGSPADYDRYGTGLEQDQWVRNLNTVLDPRSSGQYRLTGELVPQAENVTPRGFTSALLPWLGTLPQESSLAQPTLERLWSGPMDCAAVYTGNLSQGLFAFAKAIRSKLVYRVLPEAVPRRVLVGTTLKVPGIALVDQEEPLVLGPVTSIAQGGILINRGPIQISGDVARGTGGEPLTLVSLKGDIVIGAAVRSVEAYLVAVDGTVKLPSGPLTLTGGLACRDLDLDTLRSIPAERSVVYSSDHDPANDAALARSLQVFYGGDECIAVGGEN
jgi:hypothetical protein